jgi:predicted nucleic acid-binding protein
MDERILLDTTAILAYLWGEKGGAAVHARLAAASRGKAGILASEISFAEIADVVGRKRGARAAEAALQIVSHLPLRFVPCTRDLLVEAGRLKAGARASLADCVIAASAAREACPVLTADPDFEDLRGAAGVVFLR